MKYVIGLMLTVLILSGCNSTTGKEPEKEVGNSTNDEAVNEESKGIDEDLELSQTTSDVELEEKEEITDDYLMLMSDTTNNMDKLIESYGSIATVIGYGMRGDELKFQVDEFYGLTLKLRDSMIGVVPPDKYKEDHENFLLCLDHLKESSNYLRKFTRTENEELLTQSVDEFKKIVEYGTTLANLKMAIKHDLN